MHVAVVDVVAQYGVAGCVDVVARCGVVHSFQLLDVLCCVIVWCVGWRDAVRGGAAWHAASQRGAVQCMVVRGMWRLDVHWCGAWHTASRLGVAHWVVRGGSACSGAVGGAQPLDMVWHGGWR